MESEYFSHMEFDPQHHREVLGFYVPMFTDLEPVLELGCGRGEFLGLLQAQGTKATGVDLDTGMVETARDQGYDAIEADAISYLHRDAAPGPFGGVFCAHFLEHLEPEQVVRLLSGVRRVLAPGGRFVTVLPNPACYAVLSHDFWRDPTHIRFYDGPLVEFLCTQAGLEVESGGTNPANHPGPPPEFMAPEVTVHPNFGEHLERVSSRAEASLRHKRRRSAHDSDWVHELSHLVTVLSARLQETTQSLVELRRAYHKLIWGLYEPNELYVICRKPS